uniref:Mitochondrial import receptor subunit TOM7 homolog n=2 Tax=Melopsittacus undulatus TaxID=13146 RepID=A0A8C6N6N7_MELUD
LPHPQTNTPILTDCPSPIAPTLRGRRRGAGLSLPGCGPKVPITHARWRPRSGTEATAAIFSPFSGQARTAPASRSHHRRSRGGVSSLSLTGSALGFRPPAPAQGCKGSWAPPPLSVAAGMPKLSKETKQRLQQLFKGGQFAIRWGFIPVVLYLGFKRGADPGMPEPTIWSLLWG